MRKSVVLLLCLVVVAVFSCESASYASGYAAHAYVAAKLNKERGQRNENEIYGAMAPDLFNFSFHPAVYAEGGLYYQLHYLFGQVWGQKRTGMEKGLAYGFITHNDLWGVDYTAHHASRTRNPEQGYVITKAELLSAMAPELAMMVGEDAALELCHTFVEFGMEVLTKRIDPRIGQEICSAAARRDPRFPALLARAYAEGFAPFFGDDPELAAQVIMQAEGEMREMLWVYGQMLMLDEEDLVDALSAFLAGFADDYLAAYGIELPPGVDLEQVIRSYIQLSIFLCEDDYPAELRATVKFVDRQMAIHGYRNQR
jgi:hypothetical protein